MTISALSGSSSTAVRDTVQRDVSGIASEDFMNIMIKQLQLQDPFEPMTNQEMIAQMSTIRELEMNSRLTQRLEQLTDQQRFASAAALIGKQVQGTVADASGNEFTLAGVVTGVEFTESGEALLQLSGGAKLPISSLEKVTDPASPDQTEDQTEDQAEDQTVGQTEEGTEEQPVPAA